MREALRPVPVQAEHRRVSHRSYGPNHPACGELIGLENTTGNRVTTGIARHNARLSSICFRQAQVLVNKVNLYCIHNQRLSTRPDDFYGV